MARSRPCTETPTLRDGLCRVADWGLRYVLEVGTMEIMMRKMRVQTAYYAAKLDSPEVQFIEFLKGRKAKKVWHVCCTVRPGARVEARWMLSPG